MTERSENVDHILRMIAKLTYGEMMELADHMAKHGRPDSPFEWSEHLHEASKPDGGNDD